MILTLFKEIIENEEQVDSFNLSVNLVENVTEWSKVNTYLSENLYQLLDILISNAHDMGDLKYLTEVCKIYGGDFQSYLDIEPHETTLAHKIGKLFEDLSVDFSFDEQRIAETVDYYGADSAASDIDEKLWERYSQILTDLELYDYLSEREDLPYDISSAEIVQNALPEIDYYDDDDRYHRPAESRMEPEDVWKDIDHLFSKED